MGCGNSSACPTSSPAGAAGAESAIEVTVEDKAEPQPEASQERSDAPAATGPSSKSITTSQNDGGDFDESPLGGADRDYIRWGQLPEPCNLMAATLPDWEFELNKDQWKSYPVEDSILLDRFWAVFSKENSEEGGSSGAYLAKLRLMKRECLVDFKRMACAVGPQWKPRRLRRSLKDAGWLSNSFFFEAFSAAMGRAGMEVDKAAEEVFDFRFNQDFRDTKDSGKKLVRGGQPYVLPLGWKRFAVSVKGMYDAGDNAWLKEDESGWAVAYHGTSGDSLPGILGSGFHVGSRQKFADAVGSGVYCTPYINVAQHYSKPAKLEGHWVQIVLQLRVKPAAIKLISNKEATDFEKKYWVINDGRDLRAYGVLIREFHLRDYIPPEVMVYGRSHPDIKERLKKLKEEADADDKQR